MLKISTVMDLRSFSEVLATVFYNIGRVYTFGFSPAWLPEKCPREMGGAEAETREVYG